MYISPFWCGVIFTILAEIALVIVASAAGRILKDNDSEYQREEDE